MNSWLYLMVAGLLEVVWAAGLKFTDGFSRPVPTGLTVVAIVASMYCLAKATQSIPLGTAYGVWVGIGAVGSAIVGAVLFDEPLSAARVVCIILLIAAIVGLKLTSPA